MGILNNIYDKTVGAYKKGQEQAKRDNKEALRRVDSMNIPDGELRRKKVLEEMSIMKKSRKGIKVSPPIVRDSPKMRKAYARDRLKALVRGGNPNRIAEGSIEKRSKTGFYDRMQRVQD